MKSDIERLYKDVEFLTGIQPARNYAHLNSLDKTVQYIMKEFADAGYETEIQTWKADGREYKNIIASYNKEQQRRLVVGAHYDVCGDQPGADDNASAVAGLLETARLIAAAKAVLDYRIDFVAYCLEEPPYFATEKMGSYVHAESLKKNNVPVIGMICYEMIGYFSDEPGSQSFPVPEMAGYYPDKGNFIIVVGQDKQKDFAQKVYSLMKENSGIDVQIITSPTSVGLAGLSDHRCYWQFGYNAVMINDTSFLRNPNYHEITDTIDTLDFEKMGEVVNSCCRMIVRIA